MDEQTRASLVKMGNPYAKLSVLSDEELELGAEKRLEALWRTRTDVYEFISQAFALPMIRTRRPPLLTQLGAKVISLTPGAQQELHHRISAYLPEENIVYNRLSPKELDELLKKLLQMADDAAALDG